MKNKSAFMQMIFVIILAIVLLIATVLIALLAGSMDNNIFDFSNMNWGNLIPVLIIGIFISCVVIGIAVLFFGRTLFFKAKDYFEETNKNGGLVDYQANDLDKLITRTNTGALILGDFNRHSVLFAATPPKVALRFRAAKLLALRFNLTGFVLVAG